MNPTANQVPTCQQTLLRGAVMALLALVVVLLATAAFAKPPADRGGGKKGGGGGGGDVDSYQENVRLLCRAPLNGSYSRVRPAVAADGTVYVVDNSDTLFAFSPAGCDSASGAWTPDWTVPDAGGKGVAIGPDGTIYTGDEGAIKAFNPDRSTKWTFLQEPRAFILVGITVGPNGHIYGVASSGMGVFSLDDQGTQARLRWATPERYGRPIVSSSEIAVGPTAYGRGYQVGFTANGHVRVVRDDEANPETVFTLGAGRIPPRVSPIDGSWHLANTAYDPDGVLQWAFDSGVTEAFLTVAMGPDGTHYTIGQFGQAFAIDAAGSERWRSDLGVESGSQQIDVDATNSIVIADEGGAQGRPAALRALSAAGGRALWRMEFPPEPLGRDQYVDTNAAFSASGDTVYVVTAVASSDRTLPRAFLNAVNTDPSLPNASTVLRSRAITIDARARRRSVNFTGVVTVMDESRSTISGATVVARWTLPDGSIVEQTVDTGGSGQAGFKISGVGGLYKLTVTDISKGDQYRFDPRHSLLSASAVAF